MPDNPLISAVQFFRSMDFFADRAGMSDMDLAVQLGYDVTLPHDAWGPNNDALLLANDHERVWWDECAAGVEPGRRVYEKVVRDWATISRSALTLDQALEIWGAPSGPVWIKVHAGDHEERLHPTVLDGGRLDFSILTDLNRMIAPSGIELCMLTPADSMGFIVALTQDEKRRIRKERGWRFVQPRLFYR